MNFYYYYDVTKPISNTGYLGLLSYYMDKHPGRKININEYTIFDNFSDLNNKEDSYVLLSFPFFEDWWKIDIILEKLKKSFSEKKYKILLGGSALYQIVIDDIKKYYPEIDYIVIGRGELLFEKIINNEIKPGIYKSENITPFYKIHPMFLNKTDAQLLLTLDGATCSWGKCSFCFANYEKKVYDVDQVFEIIKYYYQIFNRKNFYFTDNYLNPQKLYNLLDKLLLEGIDDITFNGLGMHINSNYKRLKDYIPFFKNKLMGDVKWGVEFLDDDILNIIKKGTNVQKIFEHANFMQDNNLELWVYLINGLPLIGQKNIDNHINNLIKYDKYVKHYSISSLTLEENMEMFKMPEKYGLEILDRTALNFQYKSKYPILTTIFGYNILNPDTGKYLSAKENLERFNEVNKYLTIHNLKNGTNNEKL